MWNFAALTATAAVLASMTLGAQGIINGSGASFPNPIYQKWFAEYNKLNPRVRINYQPAGSGQASSRSAGGPCSSAPRISR
jgi:phosphate transport system substrate-binding protein